MKLPVLCLTLCYSALAWSAGPSTDAAPVASASLDVAPFADAVASCQPATHSAPHPFVKGFIIEHAIRGEVDGACAYTQSMPGGMRMECALSDAGREGLAEEFREQAKGRMSGGTSRQPGWTRDCEIVDNAGKRSRMGG